MMLYQSPSLLGVFLLLHWVHFPLVPAVQHACVLLLTGLDTELCRASIHCWVQQNFWLDSADVGQNV